MAPAERAIIVQSKFIKRSFQKKKKHIKLSMGLEAMVAVRMQMKNGWFLGKKVGFLGALARWSYKKPAGASKPSHFPCIH